MPFFSVVIPLYNKETFIEDTIKSVLNQSFQDFEIVIVDDGSTDDSHKMASSFKSEKIKLLKQTNQGVSIARNNGIDYANSNYIALLDADDLWHNHHLIELKKQIDIFPNAGLFCNNYEIFHKENFSSMAKFNFDYKNDCLLVEDYFKASIINTVALTSAVAFSKEKFKILGGFKPNLKTGQDSDLWVRFALHYKVSFNPVITMSYKAYIDDSLSKSEFNSIRYDFINNYLKEEIGNPSLKLYLDVNRYALAIRSRINDEKHLYLKLKNEIDFNNLNSKQKILIRLPKGVIKFIKKFHVFLISNNFYFSSYS
ncbi:glycosyltransferase family 2 protein [Confluentibacter citreus]|uniref:glycosyltransferase family 2 protein n=1 Tax=Confluentibacter citreus TaxID=2007307 RepID=UPI000C28972C|nr:glycosyltransferase family 2 protein [Confluentibacter citreus]